MYQTIRNPFSMTNEQLLDYAMSESKQDLANIGSLNTYPILGTEYKAYNPYQEIFDRDLDGERNRKNADFFTEPDYKKPAFQEQDPNEVLISLNVREQADEFRRQQATQNSINSLFNPVSGNTPEERAKSQNINKLLAEIDNFAIQYRLSKSQMETLKTQVLSNHLGEYIQTKNALVQKKKNTEEADAMALAKGENKTGDAPVVRDPVNGADEHGIRNDADEESVEAPIDEESQNDTMPDSARTEADNPNGGGGAASGVGVATEPLSNQQVKESARLLVTAVEADGEVEELTKNAILRFRTDSWDKAFRLYTTPSVLAADVTWERDRRSVDVINFLLNVFGYGERLSQNEIDNLKLIIAEAKRLLK